MNFPSGYRSCCLLRFAASPQQESLPKTQAEHKPRLAACLGFAIEAKIITNTIPQGGYNILML